MSRFYGPGGRPRPTRGYSALAQAMFEALEEDDPRYVEPVVIGDEEAGFDVRRPFRAPGYRKPPARRGKPPARRMYQAYARWKGAPPKSRRPWA